MYLAFFLIWKLFVFAANLLFSSTMSGVPQSALQGPWEVAERATPSLTTCESVSAEPVHRVDLESMGDHYWVIIDEVKVKMLVKYF